VLHSNWHGSLWADRDTSKGPAVKSYKDPNVIEQPSGTFRLNGETTPVVKSSHRVISSELIQDYTSPTDSAGNARKRMTDNWIANTNLEVPETGSSSTTRFEFTEPYMSKALNTSCDNHSVE
jgi:hypothetical protein